MKRAKIASHLQSEYYVYAQGKVLLSTDDVADAVLAANEAMGVVIDKNQQYVWKRSRKTSPRRHPFFHGTGFGCPGRRAGSAIAGASDSTPTKLGSHMHLTRREGVDPLT